MGAEFFRRRTTRRFFPAGRQERRTAMWTSGAALGGRAKAQNREIAAWDGSKPVIAGVHAATAGPLLWLVCGVTEAAKRPRRPSRACPDPFDVASIGTRAMRTGFFSPGIIPRGRAVGSPGLAASPSTGAPGALRISG